MIPEDCPRFQTCSAAICPIDPRWKQAVHLQGERICYYLTNSGKQGATERFADDKVFLASLSVLPEVTARHPDIARKVATAARSGFKGGHLRKETRLALGDDPVDSLEVVEEGVS